jgi:hypothetical protein
MSLVFNPAVNARSQLTICRVGPSTQLTTYTGISCVQSSFTVKCLFGAVGIFTTLKKFTASSVNGFDGTSSHTVLEDIQEITSALDLYKLFT